MIANIAAITKLLGCHPLLVTEWGTYEYQTTIGQLTVALTVDVYEDWLILSVTRGCQNCASIDLTAVTAVSVVGSELVVHASRQPLKVTLSLSRHPSLTIGEPACRPRAVRGGRADNNYEPLDWLYLFESEPVTTGSSVIYRAASATAQLCCTYDVGARRLHFERQQPGELAITGSVTDITRIERVANRLYVRYDGERRQLTITFDKNYMLVDEELPRSTSISIIAD